MTREQREKLCEIMGYLWAKADENLDDSLCAGYAESLGEMLAEDEREQYEIYTIKAESEGRR